MNTQTIESLDEMELNRKHINISILSAMGAFLDGYDTFIIGGALLLLKPMFHLKAAETGMLGSASFLGALIGAYVFGHVSDRLGRRRMFLLTLATFGLTSIMLALSQSYTQLLLWRFVLGVAIGADLPINAAVIAEFSPKKYRGRLTAMIIMFLFAGGILANVVAMILYNIGGIIAWRWMFLSGVIPAVIVLFLRRSIPESPRWLLKAGKSKEADAVVAILKGDRKLSFDPLKSIRLSGEQSKYSAIFQSGYLRSTVIVSVVWFLLNSMSSSFTMYTPVIFKAFGLISDLKSLEFAVITQSITLIITVVAAFNIDRLGRRKILNLLMIGTIVGALILLIQQMAHLQPPAVLVAGVALAQGTLGASGIVMMVLAVESYSTEIRATAEGFAIGSNKLGAYMGTLGVPVLLAFGGIVSMMTIVIAVALIAIILGALLKQDRSKIALEER